MRIGTWNVEYARGVDKNVRRLNRLRQMDADIWILTETHDDLQFGPEYHQVTTTPRPGKGPNARWATIWSRFPIERPIPVEDPCRTTAALLGTPAGPLIVFGTVLPWHSDGGPGSSAWAEFYRIAPQQAREWSALRAAFPDAALCVAGDLNMNLGGKHWYGTNKGRALLRKGLAEAGLVCATEADLIPTGCLSHAPIDHVCLSPPLAATARVSGAWNGTDSEGVRLSDHSGLVVETTAPSQPQRQSIQIVN